MGTPLRVVLAAVLALVALKAVVSLLEPRLVFLPQRGEPVTPAAVGLSYEPLRLHTADGETLAAWQLEPASAVAEVVYFHGNGGNLSMWLPVFEALHRHRLRVLAVDYRGYGLSTGSPTEQGLYRDAEAVLRHVAAHRTPFVPLVYWGRSLGATVAAYAAGLAPPDGLVLEGAFPDKSSVIGRRPLLRLLNLLSTYRLPTAEWLARYDGPVLVVHGERDRVIPPALGRQLFEAAGPQKRFALIAGADHNDFFPAAAGHYWAPILDFIGILESRRT